MWFLVFFFFSSRRRHTRCGRDWSSDVCSSDLAGTLCASCGNLAAFRNQRAGIPIMQGNAWGMLYGAIAAAALAVMQGVPFAFDPRAAYLVSLVYLVIAGSIAAF